MDDFSKYDMTHKQRGIAYIFNNEEFRNPNLETRYGSTKDTLDFKVALKSLGFREEDIIVYVDATTKEMLEALEKFDEENPDCDINCFICVILSGGADNDVIYAYDGEVELEELLSRLRPDRCSSLTGIPKLIFVQANRGSRLDVGVERNDYDAFGFEEKPPKIPIMADMLVFHSSCDEYPSFEDNDKGSWFMQTLSKILLKYGTKYDILTLLTAVSKHVASLELRNHSEFAGSKQMPQIMSTLRKELKFELGN